jgi:L-asparaginase II
MTPQPTPGSGIAADNPPLAEVVRTGFAESRHRGAIAVVDPDGTVMLRAGAVDSPVFPPLVE